MKAISARVFVTGCHSASALDIVGAHEAAVFLPQQVFQQNANGEGKLVDVADSPALERIEAMDFVALTTGL